MESYKYNIVKRLLSATVLDVAYIRDEVKIRYVVENADSSNVIRIEARLVGQSTWDILSTIIGSDSQVIDIATYEEVRVSLLIFDSFSNYVDIIGSSFENVSTVQSVNGQTHIVNLTSLDIPYTPTIGGDWISNPIDIEQALDELAARSSSGVLSKYTLNFLIADWVIDGAEYKIEIPETTHLKGIFPLSEIYETIGLDEELVDVSTTNDETGKVTIRVSGTPDLRFNGLITIS